MERILDNRLVFGTTTKINIHWSKLFQYRPEQHGKGSENRTTKLTLENIINLHNMLPSGTPRVLILNPVSSIVHKATSEPVTEAYLKSNRIFVCLYEKNYGYIMDFFLPS